MNQEPLKRWGSWKRKVMAAENPSPPAESATQSQPQRDRFDKFTLPARGVLIASGAEAQLRSSAWIGTEHLLLALTHGDSGMPSFVMHSLGVSRGALLSALPSDAVSISTEARAAIRRITPQTRRAVQIAVDEARIRAMHYVTAEHILFGVTRMLTSHPSEPANHALRRLNVSPAELERRVQVAFDHSRRFGRPRLLVR